MKISRLMVMILIAGVIMLALLGCNQVQPGGSNTYFSSQQEGIWVSGTGKVTVNPDLATLSVGVEAQESTVAQAQNEASQAMDNVINVLKTQQLADKDIQTQYFTIQQVTRYDPTTQQEVVTGYRVTNLVTAKIRKLDKVGTIIDTVAQAGGNLTRVSNLSFSVEDPTQYYSEARTKAVNDAKQTANQLASLNNVKLGKPTYISQGALSVPLPISLSIGTPVPSPSPVTQTSISPGQIDITLTVQVAYEISQ